MFLSEREMTIGEVAGHFEMTRPAIKKHLVILEEGHLISSRQRGRERVNRLMPDGLKHAADWLNAFDRFWDTRLAALKNAVEAEEERNDD